jgi:hypothetical protein
MTSPMNSRYAFKCIAVIGLIAMAAFATAMAMSNSQLSATPTAAMDVYAMHGNVNGATLPDMTVAEAY